MKKIYTELRPRIISWSNLPSIVPVVILIMSPYNSGQSCHLQHEVVAHSCYELPSKPWLRLHCYAAHESQRPYNIHHDTKRKRKMHRVVDT